MIEQLEQKKRITYGSKVKITKDFYLGMEGKVINTRIFMRDYFKVTGWTSMGEDGYWNKISITEYLVKLEDSHEVWIEHSDLELI